MGCTGFRGSEGEMLIRETESTLLPTYSAFLIFKAFQDFVSESDKITREELEQIYGKVSPALLPNDNRATSILLTGEYQASPYPLKELLCLYILISIGGNRLKAELLFKTYACVGDEFISANNLAWMIRDIFDVSCKHLPRVAIKYFKGEKASLDFYYHDLNQCRIAEAISESIQDIMDVNGNIKQQQFIETVTSNHSYLLYARKVREFCLNYYFN